MTISVSKLATVLQTLLTTTADQAARQAGFIRRQRKITGARFVQALVLGWMADPRATIDQLALSLKVTVQSLHQRFNDAAVDCLQQLLQAATQELLAARPETIPLLRRFTQVGIEDSTSCGLSADLAARYPGCGGSDSQAGRAGVKILVRLDALTGQVQMAAPVAARTSDRPLAALLPALPRGSLRLADLGFFDLQRMARDTEQGVWWISRVPARLSVREGEAPAANIADWLASQTADQLDATVSLGTKNNRLDCRLVAVRTPSAIARLRLSRLKKQLKKKGRKLSGAQRTLCQWTVMITNLSDAQRYPTKTLWALYKVRWQVELLFKRWKSGGGLGQTRGRSGPRVLCELLAKLLGVLIKHWATLLGSGPLGKTSATRADTRVRRWASHLEEAIASGPMGLVRVEEILKRLKAELDRLPKRPRRKRPTARQYLFAPRFVA